MVEKPIKPVEDGKIIGNGRIRPNPLTSYMDARGFAHLRTYISSYWIGSPIFTEFDCGLEQLSADLDRLYETVPEIKDFSGYDSGMYPIFYYSLLMYHLVSISKENFDSGTFDARMELFLEGLAEFLGVPGKVTARVQAQL